LLPDTASGKMSINDIKIEKLETINGKGFGYRLTYVVPVPVDVYWNFKTDFNNDFLVTSKHISSHRLIKTSANEVVTENQYTSLPKSVFKWRTLIDHGYKSLSFSMIPNGRNNHKYHYGRILVQAKGNMTAVTQEAYFDFFGASFWVNYPWYGGMKQFLRDIAKWEQQKAFELKTIYLASAGL
jgi:hypothetical protein